MTADVWAISRYAARARHLMDFRANLLKPSLTLLYNQTCHVLTSFIVCVVVKCTVMSDVTRVGTNSAIHVGVNLPHLASR